MRIFIHGVDTYLGRALVQDVRRTERGLHRVFGTVRHSAEKVPKAVKRIVSRSDPKKAKKMVETMRSCGLVIIDLFNWTLDDLLFALLALKVDAKSQPPRSTGDLENEVTFILISSVMVWSDTEVIPTPTEPEQRAEADMTGPPGDGSHHSEAAEESGSVQAEEGASVTEEAPEAEEETREPNVVLPPDLLRDVDFERRKPTPGSVFERWKDMEDLVMRCFKHDGCKVKSFVVAGGVLYGSGEDTFVQLFKNAWLGRPAPDLQGSGRNRIPTVHVRDLARLVRTVGLGSAELDPHEKQYYLAVDTPPSLEGGYPGPSTQEAIIQGIVNEVCGPGAVPWDTNMAMLAADADELQTTPPELQEALSLDLFMEPSRVMLEQEFADMCIPSGWLCKEGIVANLAAVASEFCEERKLQALRVLIAGPPASGKSTLAHAVAEHFNIPHVELRDQGEDAETAVGHTAETLSSKICRYRGFVLETGIAGHKEVEALFCRDAPSETLQEEEDDQEMTNNEEEKQPPKLVRKLNDDLCPTFVILLQAPEPLCRARWRSRSSAPLEEFQDRMDRYRERNLTDDVLSLSDFFQMTAKRGILNLPIAGKDDEEMFESTRIFMEGAGRPFNYLKDEEAVADQILAKRGEHEEIVAQREQEENAQQAESAGSRREEEAQCQAERMYVIAKHEEQRREIEALTLREYLMKYAVPKLTEGLIEVCKVLPENPVDYLANYLESQASSCRNS